MSIARRVTRLEASTDPGPKIELLFADPDYPIEQVDENVRELIFSWSDGQHKVLRQKPETPCDFLQRAEEVTLLFLYGLHKGRIFLSPRAKCL